MEMQSDRKPSGVDLRLNRPQIPKQALHQSGLSLKHHLRIANSTNDVWKTEPKIKTYKACPNNRMISKRKDACGPSTASLHLIRGSPVQDLRHAWSTFLAEGLVAVFGAIRAEGRPCSLSPCRWDHHRASGQRPPMGGRQA